MRIVEDENSYQNENIFDLYQNQSEDFMEMLKYIKANATVIDELIKEVTGDFALRDCHQYIRNAVNDQTRYGALIPIMKLMKLTNLSYYELLGLNQPHKSGVS